MGGSHALSLAQRAFKLSSNTRGGGRVHHQTAGVVFMVVPWIAYGIVKVEEPFKDRACCSRAEVDLDAGALMACMPKPVTFSVATPVAVCVVAAQMFDSDDPDVGQEHDGMSV